MNDLAEVTETTRVNKMMADMSASITDFKANPNAIISQSGGEAVAVLKSNAPCFYAVPPALFETMYEAMENLALITEAQARLSDGERLIAVDVDDL